MEELNNIAFSNSQISVRLSDEDLKILNEFYFEAIGAPGASVKQSFLSLLDLMYKGVRKIDNPEHLKTIEKLKSENADLKDEVEKLKNRIVELEQERDNALNMANENAQCAASAQMELEKHIILDNSDLVKEMNIIQKALKLSNNKDLSFNEITTMMITSCRKTGTFIVNKDLRNKIEKIL